MTVDEKLIDCGGSVHARCLVDEVELFEMCFFLLLREFVETSQNSCGGV